MDNGLFNQLRQINLPIADYAVFGSGPLAVRGIIPSCNDLDVLCRRKAWALVSQLGTMTFLSEYGVSVVSLCDGAITFGLKWGIGDFDVDELIDTAEIIDSLPFVLIEHVVSYKKTRSSARDISHLQALENFDSL